MRALGDKIGSTLIAQSAGVACMPWSGSGLEVEYKKTGIPDDIYRKSCVTTIEECEEAVKKIGYPIMIKASEGGGGKGIRMVKDPKDLALSFEQVQGEVPGSPIFLMKLAETARHLEVQLLGDEHGDAIAIFGRDCSVQRRHQKIIEEGPVVAAPPDLWRKMEKAAVALAKEVGYTCAGTVEYLYMEDQNDYCFLELNPRLQVEHPVTELISGINLPAAQVLTAMGIPLHRMAEVRRMYGKDPNGSSPIDFDNTPGRPIPGHVIACRITAENPEDMFTPTSGHIVELNFRSTSDVWGYFSVSGGGGVHEFSDSQFGHMFATGRTRDQARRAMVLALKELSIRGDIRTTVEYLRQLLETPDFKKNRITTKWLDELMRSNKEGGVMMARPRPFISACLGAVFRAHAHSTETLAEYIGCLERGQFPAKHVHDDLVTSQQTLIYEDIKYEFTVHVSGPGSYTLVRGDWSADSEVITLADQGLLVSLNGKKFVVYGKEFPSGLRLTLEGCTLSFTEEYDPTNVKSNLQGKLVRYLCEDGAHINKGEALAEVEVMKMYITMAAPEAGVVTHKKPAGSVLAAGELVATMDLDNPDAVKKADIFEGKMPHFKPAHPEPRNVSMALSQHLDSLKMMLNGYRLGPGVVTASLEKVLTCLRDPMLPLAEFQTVISSLAGRLPEGLFNTLNELAHRYAAKSTHRFVWEKPQPFPVQDMVQAINDVEARLSVAQRAALETNCAPLKEMLQHYADGNHTRAIEVIEALLSQFFDVEHLFSNDYLPEYVIGQLRKEHKSDLMPVIHIARAHHQLDERKELVKSILDVVNTQFEPMTVAFLPVLHKLCKLTKATYSGVVLKARRVLIRHDLPSPQERLQRVQTLLSTTALDTTSPEKRVARLDPLIHQSQPIEDLIFSFIDAKKHRCDAVETYIRRSYHMYRLRDVNVGVSPEGLLLATWEFGTPLASRNLFTDAKTVESSSPAKKGKAKKGKAKKNSRKSSESESTTFELQRTQSGMNTTIQEVPSAGRDEYESAVMAFCDDFDALQKQLSIILSKFSSKGLHRVLYLGFQSRTSLSTDDNVAQYLQTFVQSNKSHLHDANIKKVTFIEVRSYNTVDYPRLFTFKSKFNFEEDRVVRHIEPASAFHLQLERLSCFKFSHVDSANREYPKHGSHTLKQESRSTKIHLLFPFSYFFCRDHNNPR